MKETELFTCLADWCQDHSLDIWGEVTNKARREGNTADAVVKITNNVYASIELKTSLNLTVLGQASLNLKYYNASIIGVPAVKSLDVGRLFAYQIIKEKGIGLIEFYPNKDKKLFIPASNPFTIPPRLKVRPLQGRKDCAKWLTDEHKNIIGGSQHGKSTVWMKAMNICKEFLEMNGLASVDDLYHEVSWYFKRPRDVYRALTRFAPWAKGMMIGGIMTFEYIGSDDE